MLRKLLGIGVALTFVAAAGAQTTATQPAPGDGLADRSPSENVGGGVLRARAPSVWTNAARSRHNQLMQDRLRAARFGDNAPDAAQGGAGSSGSSTSGSGLSSLLGLLGGGGSIANSFGNSLGGGTPATGGTLGSGGSIDQNTLAMLLNLLAASGVDTTGFADQLGSQQKSVATQKSYRASIVDLTGENAVMDLRAQTNNGGATTTEPFKTRLVNSLLTTLFSSLTLAFQSADVIGGFADFFTPLFAPPATDGGTTDGGATDGGATDGGTTDGGGSTGGGIEDVPPTDGGNTDGGNNDGGSVI